MGMEGFAGRAIENVPLYWLKGEPVQNFGDYLTELLVDRLFYGVGLPGNAVYIIGSTIDDGLLPPQPVADGEKSIPRATIFWGCGLRHERGLSDQGRERSRILAVRGPLSRSALKLGIRVPIGDPALLLPALYQPQIRPSLSGKKVLVPHFTDQRSDSELLSLSGCDVVLRPNIEASLSAITDFIDNLVSADFVLAGALHAAIVAGAYKRPFGYWDSGQIDIPFKWHDFSASVEIPCAFHKTADSASTHYESEIRDKLRIPPLLPLLAAAPFPVRQTPLIRVALMDFHRHGEDVVSLPIDVSVEASLAAETWAVRERYDDAMKAAKGLEGQLSKALSNRDSTIQSQQIELAEARTKADDAEARAEKLKTQLSETFLVCDNALTKVVELQAQLKTPTAHENAEAEKQLRAILHSTTWRITGPARRLMEPFPRLRAITRATFAPAWRVLRRTMRR